LVELKTNRHLLRSMAEANRRLALELGDPAALRQFWRRQLRLP